MMTRTLASIRAEEQPEKAQALPGGEEVVLEEDPDKPDAHISVMVHEVLDALALVETDLVVDATAGMGGHSFEMLSAVGGTKVLALDADRNAVAKTTERLKKFAKRASVVESNFAEIEHVLRAQGLQEVNKVLFDLGWNSTQLRSGRGFSFKHDEALDMSYGRHPSSGFTAREVLNGWDEKTLADVLYGYGDEQYARRIAKAIITRRMVKQIETTIELAELVADAVPAGYRHGRIHPATKTFQAIRIAVNDELGVIERGITAVWKHLAPEGRIAVITFHSVEDRVVKQLFQKLVKEEGGVLVYKKPLVPSRAEVIQNPRSRSAKLRVIEKESTTQTNH